MRTLKEANVFQSHSISQSKTSSTLNPSNHKDHFFATKKLTSKTAKTLEDNGGQLYEEAVRKIEQKSKLPSIIVKIGIKLGLYEKAIVLGICSLCHQLARLSNEEAAKLAAAGKHDEAAKKFNQSANLYNDKNKGLISREEKEARGNAHLAEGNEYRKRADELKTSDPNQAQQLYQKATNKYKQSQQYFQQIRDLSKTKETKKAMACTYVALGELADKISDPDAKCIKLEHSYGMAVEIFGELGLKADRKEALQKELAGYQHAFYLKKEQTGANPADVILLGDNVIRLYLENKDEDWSANTRNAVVEVANDMIRIWKNFETVSIDQPAPTFPSKTEMLSAMNEAVKDAQKNIFCHAAVAGAYETSYEDMKGRNAADTVKTLTTATEYYEKTYEMMKEKSPYEAAEMYEHLEKCRKEIAQYE